MKILLALTRYADIGKGDVKQLKGSAGFRLRVGDYRVRMMALQDGRIRIAQAKHRREAYRWTLLSPIIAIQTPILHRLRQVLG